MWKYSEKLMDHFQNPRNVGTLESPDGHADVGSPVCGDAMTLDILVDDDDRIADVRFRTFGCAGAIASASALTEMALGKTLDEALAIRNRDIADYLGGMPEEKYHCSVMGHEALHMAIRDYREHSSAVEMCARDILSGTAALPGGWDLSGISIVRARPSEVLLSSSGDVPDGLASALSEAVSERAGRPVEVRFA